MSDWLIIVITSLISIILDVSINAIIGYIRIRKIKINQKNEFKWKINKKFETSFLLTKLKSEEILNKKIEGDWLNLIKSFFSHFKFFQNLIIEEGYKHKELAKKWELFINNDLRYFLVKWEKYSNLESKNNKLDQPKDFFIDLLILKKKSKLFYQKIL